jgi:hypothetical protein
MVVEMVAMKDNHIASTGTGTRNRAALCPSLLVREPQRAKWLTSDNCGPLISLAPGKWTSSLAWICTLLQNNGLNLSTVQRGHRSYRYVPSLSSQWPTEGDTEAQYRPQPRASPGGGTPPFLVDQCLEM